MSAKFLALVVLVKLFAVGQAATLEHIHNAISHKAGQTDGTSKNARIDEITLDQFTWTYSSTTSEETSVTVCTQEPINGLGQTVEQVTLLTTTDDGSIMNCIGTFDETGKKCSTFIDSDTCAVALPSGNMEYTLEVYVSTIPSAEVNYIGSASFTMTVEAATLTCGGVEFIRARTTGASAKDACEAEGVADVCYQKGNLAVAPFCFTESGSKPAELILCLGGDNHYDQAPDGELTINQLAHNTPPGSATFSLTHMDSVSTAFEAIVLKDNAPLHSCYVTTVSESSGTCEILDLTGGNAEYKVCTILPALATSQTALATIRDLDFQAEVGLDLLQFRFTNANPYMKYVVKLDSYPPEDAAPTVHIDCTGVTPDHICYGFIENSPIYPFLTVEYLAADETTSNKISILYPGFVGPIL